MAERPESLGLQVLYEGSNPSVDIVAVHGLGATPDWAWIRKVKIGDQEVSVNWLADENMLPAKLPNSRIMTFNYESNWLLGAPMQRRCLCAIQLLTAIDNKRNEEKDTKHRPLIFIGHSFGGVVIEQCLVSANPHNGDFQYLALSTVGIIFLGTPHRGTQAAKWGEFVARSGKFMGLGAETSILKDLRADSENLKDLLYEFTLWANRVPISLVCYFELYATDYGKRFGMTWKELVVDEKSACIDGHRKVPLSTDHLKINKYSGPDDPSYIAVYPLIVHMARDAISIVQGRMNPQTTVEDDSRIPRENLECLRALFLTNPQDDLAAIRSAKGDRVDGTCEWVLTQHQYTSWLVEESPKLLWLSGAPGIGKTMISSFLVEQLTRIAERSLRMRLAYYFCDDKYQKRRTATAILRGLLLQILRQRPILFKYIQTSFDISRDSLFTNFHALWRIFVTILHDPEVGEVCCLIDALDECEKDSRQLFLFEFTKLFSPQQSKRTFVKFIITSRWENDIAESLSVVSPASRHLQVDSGKVNSDLSEFINARVDTLSKMKGYDLELKKKIESALTEKAGGTFLFVSLVLHDLKTTKATFQVQLKLRELPSDLNKLYDGILAKIGDDCQEIAKLILCWVALARRPLTVDELAMALILSTNKWEENSTPPKDRLYEFRDAFRCCEPLVNLDSDHGTINLVHQSVKDYLLSAYLKATGGLSQYYIVPDSTNLLMFRTCWKFLSFEEFRQGTMLFKRIAHHYLCRNHPSEDFNDKNFFLRYAEPQWQEHAISASPALATDIRFWNKNLAELPTLRDALLLRAVAEGQYMIVQRLLENGAQMKSRDAEGWTPLLLASREGHEKILELLLEWGKAWINCPRSGGQTPLHEAAEAGHTTVVKLLLSRGDVIADPRDIHGMTPLLWAARNGRKGVVELLLSHGDVTADFRDRDGKTPLVWAVRNGHEAVVKLLVSREDVAASSQDRHGMTPLLWAARDGHEAVVKLFLGRDDVTADSPDNNGTTPLSWAAAKGHERVVRLLLSRDDIAVNYRDETGRIPLALATRNGHEGVVRLLLSRDDTAVNSRDNRGRTALIWAAASGHVAVVRLLLSRNDVDVNSRDNQGLKALVWAVMNEHEAVVRLLVTRDDIDVNSRDNEGRTALAWAKGNEPTVEVISRQYIGLQLSQNQAIVELLEQKGAVL